MKTISIFAASGSSFVRPIMDALAADGHKCEMYKGRDVERLLQADVVWCDWADQLTASVSQKTDRPMIVRLHSYELFTDFPGQIDWSKVRHLVFVAKHVQAAAVKKWPQLADVPQSVIPNVVEIPAVLPEKTYKGRVAIVGTITHKKSPPLLLEACRALHATGQGYSFHFAGEIADERYRGLFDEAIGGGIPITLDGHVDDVPAWLKDKDFILNASPWEGNPVAVLEGVAAGCIPLVHAWPGASDQYPSRWIWPNLRKMVETAECFRRNVQANVAWGNSSRQQNLQDLRFHYDPARELARSVALVNAIEPPAPAVDVVHGPTGVAAAMIVRNEAKGLKKCLRSIRGIADEVFIFDTGSTDGTRKIAVAEGAHLFTDPVPESVAGRIHFGDARNVIIGKVPDTFRWILIIDGDEVLTDVGDLRQALELHDVDALGVRVVSVGDEGAVADQIQARLFRHGRIEYIYPVHNQPVGWEGMTATTAIIHAHYEGQQSAKAHRSIPILEEQAEADGTNPRWAKLLAQTYLMLAAAENDEAHLRTALVWSRRCRDLAADDARHADNWPRLVRLTAQVAGLEAAEKIAAEGVALFPDLADLRYEQFILTAFAWHGACSVARTKYPLVGQGSLRLAGRLSVAAQALEMPIQFEEA